MFAWSICRLMINWCWILAVVTFLMIGVTGIIQRFQPIRIWSHCYHQGKHYLWGILAFFMSSVMFVYVWAIDARLVGDYKYMCCVLKSPNGRPLWLSLWGAQCIHVRHNSSCTIVQLFITLWWMIKTPSKVLSWSKRVDRCCGLCVGISFASARLSVWG
jgi:hypothetical protein